MLGCRTMYPKCGGLQLRTCEGPGYKQILLDPYCSGFGGGPHGYAPCFLFGLHVLKLRRVCGYEDASLHVDVRMTPFHKQTP